MALISVRKPGRAPLPDLPDFACARGRAGDASSVILSGELDIAVVPELDRALRRAEAESKTVVVDLRDLEFMDCAAAELLLTTHRRIGRAGGRLTVVPGTAEVAWFLTLLGMERQLDLVDEPPRDR